MLTTRSNRGATRRLIAFIAACALLLQPTAALASRNSTDLVAGERAGGSRVRKLPDLDAPSGVLVTMDGRELWGRQPEAPRAMASITKVMTAILVLERLRDRLDEKVTLTADIADVEESSARWKPGMRITVRELLEAAMVHSSNGAALALAKRVAGTETDFVQLMNEKAEALDLEDTLYVNAHGLDDPGHHSTARDIAVLVRYAMANPEFRRMARMQQVTVPGPNGPQTLQTTNKLLASYRGAEGIKTGWTGDAGYCLSAAAKRRGVELVAIVLGTDSEQERFDESAKLLDWGFKHYRNRQVAAETTVGTVPVADYLDVTVPVRVGGSRTMPVFEFDGPIRRRIDLNEKAVAPIKAGQRLGTVTVYQGDRLLAQLPATAAFDVQRPGVLLRMQIGMIRLWRSVFGGSQMAAGSVVAQ